MLVGSKGAIPTFTKDTARPLFWSSKLLEAVKREEASMAMRSTRQEASSKKDRTSSTLAKPATSLFASNAQSPPTARAMKENRGS